MKKFIFLICLFFACNCFAGWSGQRYQASHGKHLRNPKVELVDRLLRISSAPIVVLPKTINKVLCTFTGYKITLNGLKYVGFDRTMDFYYRF